MNETEQALYDRILKFSFDEGDEKLTFARRLARENGWTRSYTARVIDEYKRFIFLAVSAGHLVTPSDQVDQVWHLHLLYTHSYWDRFCGQVLGAPLHHDPTRGGGEEARRFNNLYAMTLQSYNRFFGQEPPADIWPGASIRFGDDLSFQRINTKRNWVIAKRQLTKMAEKIVVLVLLTLAFDTLSPGIKALLSGSERSWPATVPMGSRMSSVPASVQPVSSIGKPDKNDSQDLTGLVIFLSVGIVFTIVFFAIFDPEKCPECKQRRAFKYNGNERASRWVPGHFGMKGRFETEQEYQCKYCGHREWREVPDGCACA